MSFFFFFLSCIELKMLTLPKHISPAAGLVISASHIWKAKTTQETFKSVLHFLLSTHWAPYTFLRHSNFLRSWEMSLNYLTAFAVLIEGWLMRNEQELSFPILSIKHSLTFSCTPFPVGVPYILINCNAQNAGDDLILPLAQKQWPYWITSAVAFSS